MKVATTVERHMSLSLRSRLGTPQMVSILETKGNSAEIVSTVKLAKREGMAHTPVENPLVV